MQLTIPEFVFAVLAASGFAVVAMSIVSRWRHARSEARSLRARLVCRLCQHAFLDESHAPRGRVLPCPMCGAANQKGGTRDA